MFSFPTVFSLLTAVAARRNVRIFALSCDKILARYLRKLRYGTMRRVFNIVWYYYFKNKTRFNMFEFAYIKIRMKCVKFCIFFQHTLWITRIYHFCAVCIRALTHRDHFLSVTLSVCLYVTILCRSASGDTRVTWNTLAIFRETLN